VPLIVVYFVANSTNNDTFNKVFTEFVRIHPKLSDAGFGGYSLVAPNTMQRFYIAPNATQAQANETVDPFLAFAPNLTEGLNISAALTVPYPLPLILLMVHVAFFNGSQQVGTITEMASRLITRDTFEQNPQGIADTILYEWRVVGYISRNFISMSLHNLLTVLWLLVLYRNWTLIRQVSIQLGVRLSFTWFGAQDGTRAHLRVRSKN